jgi:two-component system response regulator
MERNVILLVEDNADDELLILRTLRKHNLANEIVVARDGAEALDYLFRTGAHAGRGPETDPRVVVLDLKLPKIPGHGVLQRIRADERTKRLPVVILTSSDEEQDVARSYDLGANGFVRKPVDFAAFSEAVRTLGMYWVLINRPPAGGAR